MGKRKIAVLISILCLSLVQAARLDTLKIKSPSMHNRNIEVLMIVPDKAIKWTHKKFPVLYLLHGHGGNAFSWIKIKPDLPEIADKNEVIIVCPDAENSWYWDAPENTSSRFETFMAKELIEYVDNHYQTIAGKQGRGVTGYSMGGHGAIWLAFRYKEVFGAAGSISGGLDIRPFPNSWEIKKHLGEKSIHPEVWDQFTVINQVNKIGKEDLALIIDCGYDDFFFKVNKDFHSKLLARGIAHDYIVRPGAHTADYWNNAFDYQLLFFKKYFNKNK